MSLYKDLYKKDMPKYLELILNGFRHILDSNGNVNIFQLRYCLILLYEYCICYSYFALNPSVSYVDGKDIKVSHLRIYVSTKVSNLLDLNMSSVRFMHVRNHSAHLA